MSTVSIDIRLEMFRKEKAETLSSIEIIRLIIVLRDKYKEAEVINK